MIEALRSERSRLRALLVLARSRCGDYSAPAMSIEQEIIQAERLIRSHVRETPVEPGVGGEVCYKLENFQVTGSFKVRGAMHKLCQLSEQECAAGVIAASSGNHGAAVAYGADRLGLTARVFVPESADPGKVAVIESYGARVVRQGADCVDTEAYARALAEAEGVAYVSPYNDRDVMLGQGSIGVELERQLPELDAVFIALGGGGLISGVGSYLKARRPGIEVVACSPDQSPAMHACLEAGRILDVDCHATLSDATAGGVERGAITFDLCRQVIDRSILVTEDEIRESMRTCIAGKRMLIEGAAGVALAGFAQVAAEYRGRRAVVVLCGANIGLSKLQAVLA